MSTTFYLLGHNDCETDCEGFKEYDPCDQCLSRGTEIKVSGTNARALLRWLWFSELADRDELIGKLPAKELRARAHRRLWPEERNADPGIPAREEKTPGCATLIELGRREGYLPEKAHAFIRLADRAIALGLADILYA